jgi:hypothetical protein
MLQDEMLGNFVLIGTFIGPSKPFKLPRKNRAVTAIQKFVLRPKSVLKIILQSSIYHYPKTAYVHVICCFHKLSWRIYENQLKTIY